MLIPPQVGMLAERINISLAAVPPSVSPRLPADHQLPTITVQHTRLVAEGSDAD